jgi:predicted DNA-binding transcriptional regulator YafY
MSKSNETMYRQWLMLSHIPRYPRRVSVPELENFLAGEGYNVDTRTIQRDLNKLSISFPLSNETEGKKNYWFWIEESAVIDLPGMEPVTALAFDMAESYLLPLLPKATLNLLTPYFQRAKEVLNNQVDTSLNSWPEKVAVIDKGPTLLNPGIPMDIQQTIYQAVLEERCINASYKGRDKDERDYYIHPLGIVSRMGVIYLICTLWNYGNIKQFALHRFTHAEILDDKAETPEGFSLNEYVSQDKEFSYTESKKPIVLEALFDKRTAGHLAETPLSEDQTLSETDDGRMLLNATVLNSLELKWWLQAFGDNVEVLAPKELRQKFTALSKSLTGLYKN